MQIFSKEQLEKRLPFNILIEKLREAFCADYKVPLRHHHHFTHPNSEKVNTLLLMPAFELGKYFGVKIVSVFPNNTAYNLPSIQGTYLLMNGKTGIPLASMDAKTLTTRRTAATSALASVYLSRKDSKTLLLIGTGALIPDLIEAHTTVRPIEQVFIWGRNLTKAQLIAKQFSNAHFKINTIKTIEAGIAKADIISCATLSEKPLVFGKYLQAGQHLDMVGSFKPNMREADDEVILRSKIFVDQYEAATKESGDIFIPLQTGILKRENIQADLFELCKAEKTGRQSATEITFFKSVGHALEDLAAAKMAFLFSRPKS
ncbi:MAG TPA: ornithine cyclodeaminase family protein [Saprospiraceae bacterium]|nr:ornithine cyclodeaminase family protein [Saprospiraceae bacterium]